MASPVQIRAARALIGVKQSDLAKAAGVSLATLNNIERGVGDPRSSTLESIERALIGAGVDFASDSVSEGVTLRRLDRPSAYETLFASQRVLELLGRDSLIPVEKVLFFARRAREAPDGPPRICLLVEGRSRTVLLDRVQFNVSNGGRTAEVAAILLWAFSFHKDKLFHLAQVLDDTTDGDLPEAVARIRALEWQEFGHPSELFQVFDDWQGRLLKFADRSGHPMRDLLALFSSPQPA